LLVGKDQEESISEFILVQHSLQLLSGFNNTISVIAVNHKDDTLSVLEVMPPQRSDFVLSTHIPNSELDVLVLYSLNIEADGGDGGDNLSKSAYGKQYPPLWGTMSHFNLYKMVVFPAASRPTIRMRISFFPRNRSNNFEIVRPMVMCQGGRSGWLAESVYIFRTSSVMPGIMVLAAWM
jgi:hypothetical protein